jgi:hypothetical protein
MKSRATGLIVRPFNVTIPTCTGRIGKSTRNAFADKRLPLKRRDEAERSAKKRPVAIARRRRFLEMLLEAVADVGERDG